MKWWIAKWFYRCIQFGFSFQKNWDIYSGVRQVPLSALLISACSVLSVRFTSVSASRLSLNLRTPRFCLGTGNRLTSLGDAFPWYNYNKNRPNLSLSSNSHMPSERTQGQRPTLKLTDTKYHRRNLGRRGANAPPIFFYLRINIWGVINWRGANIKIEIFSTPLFGCLKGRTKCNKPNFLLFLNLILRKLKHLIRKADPPPHPVTAMLLAKVRLRKIL